MYARAELNGGANCIAIANTCCAVTCDATGAMKDYLAMIANNLFALDRIILSWIISIR